MANEMRMFLLTKQGREVMEKQASKYHFVSDPRATYQDHFVAVRLECLVVKKYFIPSMLPCEIPWEKIESLTYSPQNNEDKTQVPGKGQDHEGRWWAADDLRHHDRELRLYNVRVDAADSDPPKSGFTVINIDQFLKACRHLLPYSCKLNGCLWSE